MTKVILAAQKPAIFEKTSLHGRFIARAQNINRKAWKLLKIVKIC